MKKGYAIFLTVLMVFLLIPTVAFAAEGNVASVDGVEYPTVQEAIDNADGKTVVLIADATESVTIPAQKTVTLDLGEYTLTNKAGSHTITNNGTLTIKGNGVVDNISHAKGALVNYGEVTVEGGTLTRSQEKGSSATSSGGNSWYVVDNHGAMTVTGGKIINTSKYSSLIRNIGATFNMEGGELENAFITLKNDDNGVIYMTGGTVTSTSSGGSAIQNWGELNLSGGTVNGNGGAAAIYALGWSDDYNTSIAKISGTAQINGNIQMNIDTDYPDAPVPEMEITGGTVTGDIRVNTQSKLTIDDGAFEGTIYTGDQSGNIAVNGGTYEVKPDDAFINTDSTVAEWTSNGQDSFVIGTSEQVENKLSQAVAGDSVEILQGDAALTLPEDIIVTNSGNGEVSVNQKPVEPGSSVDTHVHKAVHVAKKNPTILSSGNIEYWYCESCGRYFRDAALSQEITLADTILAQLPKPLDTEYYLNFVLGDHGSVTPGSGMYAIGSRQTFTIRPDSGYVVDQVLVDGKAVDVNQNQFTIYVNSPYRITVTFKEGNAGATTPGIEVSNPNSGTGTVPNPQTGDSNQAAAWILLLGVTACGAGSLLLAKCRKERKNGSDAA